MGKYENISLLSKCCCCIPLRTGSLILAVLGIIRGFAYFGLFAHFRQWSSIVMAILNLLSYGALLFGAFKYNARAVLICLILTLLAIILGVIFSILSIAYIEILIPELSSHCSEFFQTLVGQFGIVKQESCRQLKSTLIGTAAGPYIVGSLLNIYFWISNYGFYKELKEQSQKQEEDI